MQVALASAKARKDAFPHTIMSGPPGLGKTTLAEIISGEMGVDPICIMAGAMRDGADVDNVLGKLPYDGYGKKGEVEDCSKIKFGVLFIDEIHQMGKKTMELMHTALEDYTVSLNKFHNGKVQPVKCWIPKFTMITATNYLGSLPRPFVDRFMLHLNFQAYEIEDMVNVIRFSSGKMNMTLSDEACLKLASNSRGVPRIANRYLFKARDTSIFEGGDGENIGIECVEKMFDINKIDSIGLSDVDRKVLKYLARMDRPVGLETVAHGIDEDPDTVENYVEPWLMKLGMIARTGQGRVVTEYGISHLGSDQQMCGLRPM